MNNSNFNTIFFSGTYDQILEAPNKSKGSFFYATDKDAWFKYLGSSNEVDRISDIYNLSTEDERLTLDDDHILERKLYIVKETGIVWWNETGKDNDWLPIGLISTLRDGSSEEYIGIDTSTPGYFKFYSTTKLREAVKIAHDAAPKNWVESQITNIMNSISTAEQKLDKKITDESDKLDKLIKNESDERKQEDINIRNDINSLKDEINIDLSNLGRRIDDENIAWNNAIGTLRTWTQGQVSRLDLAIAEEARLRDVEDKALHIRIDNLDQNINQNISSEIERLDKRVDNEIKDRKDADDSIRDSIILNKEEIQAEIKTESDRLDGRINSEIADREQDISNLTENLNDKYAYLLELIDQERKDRTDDIEELRNLIKTSEDKILELIENEEGKRIDDIDGLRTLIENYVIQLTNMINNKIIDLDSKIDEYVNNLTNLINTERGNRETAINELIDLINQYNTEINNIINNQILVLINDLREDISNHIGSGGVFNHALATGAEAGFSQANFTPTEKAKLESIDGGSSNLVESNSIKIDLASKQIQRAALTGDVISPQNSNVTTISDRAVTSQKIDDNAITTDKIVGNAVTTDKINDGAITTSKILNDSITTEKLKDNIISTVKLQDDSVTSTKILLNAVTTDKINDGAITLVKLATGSVNTDKIVNKSITNEKLADMTAYTIKGRLAVNGVPQDLTPAEIRMMLNVADGATSYTHPSYIPRNDPSLTGITVFSKINVDNTGHLTGYETRSLLANDLIEDSTSIVVVGNQARRAALTGDVTAPANSNNTSISSKVVTNNKLADMDPGTLKGRIGSSGEPQDLSIESVRGMILLDSTSNTINNYGQILRSALVGDVTAPANSNVLTITGKVVSNDKLADMNADTIKGRIGSFGEPQDLNATTVRTMLNVEDGANKYEHPTQSSQTINTVGSFILSGITVNTFGHVTNISQRELTINNLLDNSTSITVVGNQVQRTALTGDVTAPANSNVTTIANNAVTNIKIADNAVTTDKISNKAVTASKIGSNVYDLGDLPGSQIAVTTNEFLQHLYTFGLFEDLSSKTGVFEDSSITNGWIQDHGLLDGGSFSLNNATVEVITTIAPTSEATVQSSTAIYVIRITCGPSSIASSPTPWYLNRTLEYRWSGTSGNWKALLNNESASGASTSIILVGNQLQRAALTGDVTSPQNSNVTTIATNAVTTNKINDGAVTISKITIGGNAILGKNTSNDGQPLNLTPTQVRAMLNVEDGATKYIHPTYTYGGGTNSTGLNKMLVNEYGHIYSISGITKSDITELGIPAQDTIYSHPNHSGDVTSVGDGANTIVNNAVTTVKISDANVTNAKLANMNAATIKGRINSNGQPQDLTISQVQNLLVEKDLVCTMGEQTYTIEENGTYEIDCYGAQGGGFDGKGGLGGHVKTRLTCLKGKVLYCYVGQMPQTRRGGYPGGGNGGTNAEMYGGGGMSYVSLSPPSAFEIGAIWGELIGPSGTIGSRDFSLGTASNTVVSFVFDVAYQTHLNSCTAMTIRKNGSNVTSGTITKEGVIESNGSFTPNTPISAPTTTGKVDSTFGTYGMRIRYEGTCNIGDTFSVFSEVTSTGHNDTFTYPDGSSISGSLLVMTLQTVTGLRLSSGLGGNFTEENPPAIVAAGGGGQGGVTDGRSSGVGNSNIIFFGGNVSSGSGGGGGSGYQGGIAGTSVTQAGGGTNYVHTAGFPAQNVSITSVIQEHGVREGNGLITIKRIS